MSATYYTVQPLTPLRIVDAPEAVANLDFARGAIIADVPPTPWALHVDADVEGLPHLIGGAMPMASPALLDVLMAAGVDNLQTFPALVHLPRATRPREYWALNVIGLLDAADLESSEGTVLQEHDGRPTRIAFSRLTLSRARTLGVPMFRLAQDPSLVLVSDRIVEALDDRRPPEGWGFATVEIEMTGG